MNGLSIPKAEAPQFGPDLREAVLVAGIHPKSGPDPTAKSWGHDTSGKTFGAQEKLPKLPLPSLESSCQRYLDALKPLQSAEEHEASAAAVKKFLAGEGPILQSQLQAYDDGVLNWFEDYCYQAFLSDNSPVVYNSNAFTCWPADPTPSRNEQSTRAAALTHSTLQFSQAIREDRLPLEVFRGVPQCMNQYWWLFGAARVPKNDGGQFRVDTEARHITVMCRGQMYRLNVLEEDTGRVMGERDLATNLKLILDDAEGIASEDASKSSIGVLTTEDQKTWALCRSSLVHGSVRNRRNFEAIDSSLFVLCLDDSAPKTDQEVCRNMICGTVITTKGVQAGTCLNRWYDKLTIIVCRNGAAGMNFEHTCKDGSVDIRMACDIYAGSLSRLDYHIADNQGDPGHSQSSQNGTSQQGSIAGRLKKLDWDIPSDVQESLSLAQTHLVDRLDQHQLTTLKFRDYGKSLITSSGFSPDAFFQVAIHTAYYSWSGQVGNGFEPVLTRQFLHGRTDVARTLTPECAAFARIFNDDAVAPADKMEALRSATSAHTANIKHCAKGYSHHRHLGVLAGLWKKKRAFLQVNGLLDTSASEDPTIFSDPGWTRLGTTNVMGSNIENPYVDYAGFGAPSPDGHTVCYYLRKDYMAMSINSRNGKHEVYATAIENTFRKLKELIEEVGKA